VYWWLSFHCPASILTIYHHWQACYLKDLKRKLLMLMQSVFYVLAVLTDAQQCQGTERLMYGSYLRCQDSRHWTISSFLYSSLRYYRTKLTSSNKAVLFQDEYTFLPWAGNLFSRCVLVLMPARLYVVVWYVCVVKVVWTCAWMWEAFVKYLLKLHPVPLFFSDNIK